MKNTQEKAKAEKRPPRRGGLAGREKWAQDVSAFSGHKIAEEESRLVVRSALVAPDNTVYSSQRFLLRAQETPGVDGPWQHEY